MTCAPSIASMSLGRAWAGHSLETKLASAHDAGFKGIEVFYEDLEHLASTLPGGVTDANIITSASMFKSLADQFQLIIIALQPFMHFEGLVSEEDHRQKLKALELWFKLAEVLQTNTIQVPSNFLGNGITDDRSRIVSDLRRLADAGMKQKPPIRFAYEGLCWGRFVNKWQQVWEIIQAVDRPNFGMCLDLFHILGRDWANPAADDGKIGPEADTRLHDSLREMVQTLDIDKVYYVQAANAERAGLPMRPGHQWWSDDQPARLTWSRNMRLFPFENGSYMPDEEALAAVLLPRPLGLGYRGWVSMELFSRSMASSDPGVPRRHAERGIESWNIIKNKYQL
ncbi:uncharacterized protein PV06_01515 [Exophiala oligosperma]|uniref:Xylose isomerase-like TIM barrel domain-containing protein n=2 Tax=Chaetothyriales TaxID=34395 RepID=A0A0D2ECV0_9EURO|nr:uncharacterized protein PV06_01515 [Exophiala oligosperma]KAJ9636450.1 hypothetical protein H2204_005283 [Knufia peltigerae]KIW45804.1 hypothetical protein PV06_01515 [Exophiala oligosperma]